MDTGAPTYVVPPRDIVSVEHPCVIRNIDNGLRTLEGVPKILNTNRTDVSANLFLNPDDPMSRPISSTCLQANGVLLKISVPRRTGRKRRKGSDGPWTYDQDVRDAPRDSRYLLRSMQDNPERYKVEAVGEINRTHVFRGMPDFAFSTVASPFMARFRENILPFEYEKLKNFQLDPKKGSTSNVDIIPPPLLSRSDVPFRYIYRQNQMLQRIVDQNGQVSSVIKQPPRVFTHLVAYDIPVVPAGPSDRLPPPSTLDPVLLSTINNLNACFSVQPAWTRRALRNELPTVEQKYAIRFAVPYVAYVFRSGPWRDVAVRFGYDPRVSPDAWAYQTFMFRLAPIGDADADEEAADGDRGDDGGLGPGLGGGSNSSHAAMFDGRTVTTSVSSRRHTISRPTRPTTDAAMQQSHIFTGRPPLFRDGKIWMVRDITDTTLRRILEPKPAKGAEMELDTDTGAAPPSNSSGGSSVHPQRPASLGPRSTCDPVVCGWYGNVTHALAKVTMRAKMVHLHLLAVRAHQSGSGGGSGGGGEDIAAGATTATTRAEEGAEAEAQAQAQTQAQAEQAAADAAETDAFAAQLDADIALLATAFPPHAVTDAEISALTVPSPPAASAGGGADAGAVAAGVSSAGTAGGGHGRRSHGQQQHVHARVLQLATEVRQVVRASIKAGRAARRAGDKKGGKGKGKGKDEDGGRTEAGGTEGEGEEEGEEDWVGEGEGDGEREGEAEGDGVVGMVDEGEEVGDSESENESDEGSNDLGEYGEEEEGGGEGDYGEGDPEWE